jgi:hypothetical protein
MRLAAFALRLNSIAARTPPGRPQPVYEITGGAPMSHENQEKPLRIKIGDDILRGVYANQMVVSHTREEFILDFMNLFPPEGVVNARIIISPGHLKRIVRALAKNLEMYESKHGPLVEAMPPPGSEKPEMH